jgi:hypothetical protein
VEREGAPGPGGPQEVRAAAEEPEPAAEVAPERAAAVEEVEVEEVEVEAVEVVAEEAEVASAWGPLR